MERGRLIRILKRQFSVAEWREMQGYWKLEGVTADQFFARGIQKYIMQHRTQDQAGPDAALARDAAGKALAHFDATGKLIIGE